MSVQKALSIAQQAVVADQSQNYPEAHYLYKQVVSELEQVLYREQESSPQYQAISAKINEYRFRITEIEQILMSQGYPIDNADSSDDDDNGKEGPYPENMFPEMPPGTVVTVPDAPSAAQHQPDLNRVRAEPSSGSLYVKPTIITKPAGSDEKIIGMYNLKLPSEMAGSEAWQIATEIVARGKTKERMGEILDAFELYKCSMLYYMRALNSDDVLTRDMKRVCREQMKEYLTKAEKLKKKLAESGIDPNEGLDGADPYQQSLAAYYGNTSEGLCCICGLPLDKFICVLNRQWHPRCFVNTVKCAFCGKPFSLIDFRYVVDKETGLLYHIDCRDYTTGLVQQERREGKPGVYLFYQVTMIGKRMFMAGEPINIQFDIENNLSYKINSIRVTLIREEARSSRNALYERVESKPVMTQISTVNLNLNGKLPLGKGSLSERVSFPLDTNILPSVLTDYTLRREYRLNIKAMLSGMNGTIDKTFTVIINQER